MDKMDLTIQFHGVKGFTKIALSAEATAYENVPYTPEELQENARILDAFFTEALAAEQIDFVSANLKGISIYEGGHFRASLETAKELSRKLERIAMIMQYNDSKSPLIIPELFAIYD